MIDGPGPEGKTLDAAERVHGILAGLGIESAVIGAMALAVHGYVRLTRDFDLATFVDPFAVLQEVRRRLEKAGFRAELRLPDAEDPLGGVVEVAGEDFKPIQIVNFYNPLAPRGSTIGRDAIRAALPGLVEGSRMRVVALPYLIALKLYGGGGKGRSDVIELLERNRPLDLAPIRQVCRDHGLSAELESILAELNP